MTREAIYDLVNGCENTSELKKVLRELADEDGMIQGRTKKFSAAKMTVGMELFMYDEMPPNVITREFGLRQQAMYIKYYNK